MISLCTKFKFGEFDHFGIRAQPVTKKDLARGLEKMLIPKVNRVAVYSHLFKGDVRFNKDYLLLLPVDVSGMHQFS